MGCSRPAESVSLHPCPRKRSRARWLLDSRSSYAGLVLGATINITIFARLIAFKTIILIPKVCAFSIVREKGPFGDASYMILEYLPSISLLKVKRLGKATDD